MSRSDIADRIVLLAIGILVLLAPVLIIATVFWFLTFTGDLVLREVSLIEFLELYVLELVLVAVFAYSLYRLVLWLVEHQLPASMDTLELGTRTDDGETSDERD